MKESVVDDPPRKIAGLEFGALSPADILKQSEVEVSSRVLYDITKGRIPMEHGPLDTRLVCIVILDVCEVNNVFRESQTTSQSAQHVTERWLLARAILG